MVRPLGLCPGFPQPSLNPLTRLKVGMKPHNGY
jgi:hypothetical protein